jgi:hypothetical protein
MLVVQLRDHGQNTGSLMCVCNISEHAIEMLQAYAKRSVWNNKYLTL